MDNKIGIKTNQIIRKIPLKGGQLKECELKGGELKECELRGGELKEGELKEKRLIAVEKRLIAVEKTESKILECKEDLGGTNVIVRRKIENSKMDTKGKIPASAIKIVGKKTVAKKILKEDFCVEEDDSCVEVNDLNRITGDEILMECCELLKMNDPNSDLCQEDLAEKVEYQKDLLLKNKSKYNEKDFSTKLAAIEKVLSKLRLGLTLENLREMNDNRKKIDKIVLDKKIPKEQFKKKIDLSGKCEEPDPSYQLVTNGRKYFEKMEYLKPPSNLTFPKNRGNQALPAHLLDQLYIR